MGIAIGEASMCWSELPGGVFDSTKASALVDRIVDANPYTLEEHEDFRRACMKLCDL